MADKEATVYIVDVGASMGVKNKGRDETDLEWSMNYVWDKIATTVATGRKTACAGIVGLRTDDTVNELAEDDSYENISVFQPLGQILMQNLRQLRYQVQPSTTDDGDAISAVVVAIQMIEAFCKKLKWIRKIVLVTNGKGSMDGDQLADITSKIREEGITLVVLGVDFDDADYGFKEENKDAFKAQNEEMLKSLVEGCDGIFGTIAHAVDELTIPFVKTVRPVASYKGALTLGDAETYPTALVLDVERYPKTMIARPPTASSFVQRYDHSGAEMTDQPSAAVTNGSGDQSFAVDMSAVHMDRAYQVDDPSAPDGKRKVDRDSLAKGYEYGRTAVHISESDLNVTKLETRASLEIVGFIPSDHYERYMSMSNTHMVVAQKTNDKAKMAMASFIRALFELEDFAVARLVTKDGKEPKLVVLAPCIEPDFECLIDCEIPFAEDVRPYKFPPLDRIVTVSGKVLTEHRNLPNRALQDAMSNYVDQMDLSSAGRNDEGEVMEYMSMDETYSPILHRLNQAVRYRATHPGATVPPPSHILLKSSKPPEVFMANAAPVFDKLYAAADVKKVPPKALSRKGRYAREQDQPRSGLDITALLSSRTTENKHKISPENAIPEFKQMVANPEDMQTIQDAVSQFGVIIEDWVKHSVGDSGYDRAVEGISTMRKECYELEEPGLFNEYMKTLKTKLLKEQLGGDRREMWWKVRANRVGLIEKRFSPTSEVGEDEAKAFLSAK